MDEYFYLTKYKRETIKTVLGRHLKEVLLMNSSRLMNQIKKSKKKQLFSFFLFLFFLFFFFWSTHISLNAFFATSTPTKVAALAGKLLSKAGPIPGKNPLRPPLL